MTARKTIDKLQRGCRSLVATLGIVHDGCRCVSNHPNFSLSCPRCRLHPLRRLSCRAFQTPCDSPAVPDISLSFLSIITFSEGNEDFNIFSASSRFRSSTTDLRGSKPPSYPNQVYCLQCGPRSNRTKI